MVARGGSGHRGAQRANRPGRSVIEDGDAAILIAAQVASRRVTPYVAQIDATTMKVDVMPLTGGTAVNYTGGLLVHSNGYLYAIVRGALHKIDRSTFTEVASTSLPVAPNESGEPNEMTIFNGIDGDLILKGWASSGGGDDAPGTLLRVDPDDLSIKVSIQLTAIASARMAIVEDEGNEYIYFPGKTQSVRFLVTPTTFDVDDSWTATYLEPSSGDTMASSDIYVGDGVVFASNPGHRRRRRCECSPKATPLVRRSAP